MVDLSEIAPLESSKPLHAAIEEHESEESDADICAMKAKFNQLLSNFEQDRQSQTGTAYFNSQTQEAHGHNEGKYDGHLEEHCGMSDQENTGDAININLEGRMFSKPPRPMTAKREERSGTPDRGQQNPELSQRAGLRPMSGRPPPSYMQQQNKYSDRQR